MNPRADQAGSINSGPALTDRHAEAAGGPARELRVLHVVTRLGFGGLEVEILNLVRGLERLGFEQAVGCLQDPGELASDLPAAISVWSGSGQLWGVWRFARWLRDQEPDIVHVRNGWAWPDTTLGWLLAGRPGRLVFSFHGWDRRVRLPWRRAFLFRQLARITSALATISAETATQFAAESGIPTERFAVLDSGIDVEHYHPGLPAPNRERLILGCVGRLDPIKAHDILIAAFARALDDGRRALELRLIGDGPARPELESLVRRLGLGDHIQFCGMRRDIAEQLRELDVFVLASHREGRPISIMEAMATGLPVIATRVGSVSSLVHDEVTGTLVRAGDEADLAHAIARLADDPATRRRFGAAARQHAVTHLAVERMADQYAAFYRTVAQGRGST